MNQHNDEAVDKNFKDDFKKRIKEVKTTRWIRFGIVSLIFFLWVAWLGNWWVSLEIGRASCRERVSKSG